jgi:hypothetical protein
MKMLDKYIIRIYALEQLFRSCFIIWVNRITALYITNDRFIQLTQTWYKHLYQHNMHVLWMYLLSKDMAILMHPHMTLLTYEWVSEWVGECCLTTIQQFFSNIMAILTYETNNKRNAWCWTIWSKCVKWK